MFGDYRRLMTGRLSCDAVSEKQNRSTSSSWPNWVLQCMIYTGTHLLDVSNDLQLATGWS